MTRRERRAAVRARSGPDRTVQSSRPGPAALAPSHALGARGWLAVMLGLIVLNAAVYASVRHHLFMILDDPQYVIANPDVANGLTWAGVKWAFTSGHAANWHPLTWLSHMLDVQLNGVNPGPQHLTNVIIHTFNSALLFALMYALTAAPYPSAIVAALFAVHPLHVESVAWISERKDVLSGCFWMLTMLAYVQYVRRPQPRRWYAITVCLFALGLMAKPMLVTLPIVLLLLDVWPLGRVRGWRGVTAADARTAKRSWAQLMAEKVPLLGLAAASSIITVIVQRAGGAVTGLDSIPLERRVANAVVSYAEYIGKMLWPTRLAPYYTYPLSIPGPEAVAAGAALTVVSAIAWYQRRQRPYVLVGWAWYVVTLVPVIGLIQVGTQSMADRYTYIPLIGLFIAIVWTVQELAIAAPQRRVVAGIAAVAVVGALAVTARAQVQHWQNSVTLWTHAVNVTADNERAEYNLAVALGNDGRLDESIVHYREAVRLRPERADVRNDFGNLLAGRGRVDEAIAEFYAALEVKPGMAQAHNNLGLALSTKGRLDDAAVQLNEAIRLKPDYGDAHRNLAMVLLKQGKLDQAITHFSHAVGFKPDDPGIHNNFGVALANAGRVPEAIAQFSEAVRLKPDFQDAKNNLARARQQVR